MDTVVAGEVNGERRLAYVRVNMAQRASNTVTSTVITASTKHPWLSEIVEHAAEQQPWRRRRRPPVAASMAW
jgi:hypothetical protein